MTGISRRAIAIGTITAVVASAGVGVAGAATTHKATSGGAKATVSPAKHKSTKPSATRTRKSARDEREARALLVRERRGPGSAREERNESRAVQRKEKRNSAEVR